MNLSFSYISIVSAAVAVSLLSACAPKQASNQANPEAAQTEVGTHAKENAEVNNPSLRRSIQDEIFYFVMPDRFHNAKPENDNGDPKRPISYGGLDRSSKWAFHGGDIAGVEAKLDYIQNLGITSIWMTPILRNKAIQNDGFAHHGYWVVDFTEIDPHFGNNQELKDLIAAAHKRGIKVFFDIITNHTADVIKYKECHKDNGDYLLYDQEGCTFISKQEQLAGETYTPFLLEQEKNVKVPEWLNDPRYYNNQGDSFWQGESAVKGDFSGLDDIDTSQAEVITGLTTVFKDLITNFKPDGFRIDTVKHVDIEFWQTFGPAVMEHAVAIGIPDFFIFGEVYDGNPAGLSKFTTEGKLPSVLDFGFAFNAKDVLFNNKPVSQLAQLFDNDDYYRDHDSGPNELLNFLGNHDMGRVGHFIEQGLSNASDQEKLRRSQLAHAFMYFSRGVPVVYYGDEQGFTGDGGDVDAREDMDPSLVDVYNDNVLLGTNSSTSDNNFDSSHPIYLTLAELASIRSEHASLRHGEHINRLTDTSKQVYAFSRVAMKPDANISDKMKDYLIAFNFSTKPQTVSITTHGQAYENISTGLLSSTPNVSDDKVSFTLAPLSYSMLRSSEALPASTLTALTLNKTYIDNNRVILPFELQFAEQTQLNMARIDVYDTTHSEHGTLISFDTTAPYRAVLNKKQAADIQSIKVVASNLHGQSIVESFKFNK